jgi:predicted Holliday junction resolvase-like endonuclease
MTVTETILIITLILGIIVLLAIMTFIRKKIEETIFNKFKDLEHDNSFTDKLNTIKSEIDSVNQKLFQERIAERKEYYINDAIRRSGSVSKGKVVEHFAPFLVNDVLNPNEIVFMGSPIDLISFTNIDNEKELSIDFLEIKSGNATLNKKQKLIRNAINNRRVFYKKVMLK